MSLAHIEADPTLTFPESLWRGRPESPAVGCACQVLCLRTTADGQGTGERLDVDIDTLGQQLRKWWISQKVGARRQVRVEVSCVESCAETRQERERDARLLVELEGDAHRAGGLAQSLRATLVSLDPGEYLLLLAAPAAASAATLAGLVEELSHHYRLSPF